MQRTAVWRTSQATVVSMYESMPRQQCLVVGEEQISPVIFCSFTTFPVICILRSKHLSTDNITQFRRQFSPIFSATESSTC